MQVEDLWKTTNFTLLSHGDSKDVFILGGTDDIQVVTHSMHTLSLLYHSISDAVQLIFWGFFAVKVLLDDSIINVSTVASSRYVAPIKLKVDKLLKQLSLFNQTLVTSKRRITLSDFSFWSFQGLLNWDCNTCVLA